MSKCTKYGPSFGPAVAGAKGWKRLEEKIEREIFVSNLGCVVSLNDDGPTGHCLSRYFVVFCDGGTQSHVRIC